MGLAVETYYNNTSDWFEDDEYIGKMYSYTVDKDTDEYTAIGRLIVGSELHFA